MQKKQKQMYNNKNIRFNAKEIYNKLGELVEGEINQNDFLNKYYTQLDNFVNSMTQLRKKNLGPKQKELKDFRDDMQKIIDKGHL